jgi:hypothetical protein
MKLQNGLIMRMHMEVDALVKSSRSFPAKFSYALTKNKDVLTRFVNGVRRKTAPPPEFFAYEGERVKLCQDMSRKDEAGKPITIPGTGPQNPEKFDIIDTKEFDLKLAALQLKHKKALDKVQATQNKYANFPMELGEINLHIVDPEVLNDWYETVDVGGKPTMIRGNIASNVMEIIAPMFAGFIEEYEELEEEPEDEVDNQKVEMHIVEDPKDEDPTKKDPVLVEEVIAEDGIESCGEKEFPSPRPECEASKQI